MTYNWKQPQWPLFTYRLAEIAAALQAFDVQKERVQAVLSAFDAATEEGKRLEAMVAEAVGTSAIEGEVLEPRDVMSSMRNRLGQNTPQVSVRDYRAAGVASMLLRLREQFAQPLTEKMLWDWHRALFESYPAREAPAIVGGYRKDAIFVKTMKLNCASRYASYASCHARRSNSTNGRSRSSTEWPRRVPGDLPGA